MFWKATWETYINAYIARARLPRKDWAWQRVILKDVRANCFCASLLRTKFTRHVIHRARALSSEVSNNRALLIESWNVSVEPPMTSSLKIQKTWISLKQKKVFQEGKRHSSLLWKAFQISSNYFLLHRHFKTKKKTYFYSVAEITQPSNYD